MRSIAALRAVAQRLGAAGSRESRFSEVVWDDIDMDRPRLRLRLRLRLSELFMLPAHMSFYAIFASRKWKVVGPRWTGLFHEDMELAREPCCSNEQQGGQIIIETGDKLDLLIGAYDFYFDISQ